MKIYTVQTAAELLSVTEYTIRAWARAGKLSGARLGKEWRFTEEDIRAFLDAHRPIAQEKKAPPEKPKPVGSEPTGREGGTYLAGKADFG